FCWFFFSSRRRHTRSKRDWSSDVCSSDLAYCQGIENRLGRERDIRFGPRTIDLDILLYGEETVSTDELTVPHPRMHERAFVLVPLAELAPSYSIPKVGERVEDLLEKLPEADKKGVRDWSAEDERNDT